MHIWFADMRATTQIMKNLCLHVLYFVGSAVPSWTSYLDTPTFADHSPLQFDYCMDILQPGLCAAPPEKEADPQKRQPKSLWHLTIL